MHGILYVIGILYVTGYKCIPTCWKFASSLKNGNHVTKNNHYNRVDSISHPGNAIFPECIYEATQNETAVAQAASLGINAGTYQWIGIVEAFSVILFLIPRTAIIGSLLLIAYMGGATASHLAHQQPIIVTIIIQILVWVTVALRFPQLTQQLFFPVQKKLGHN